jgi:phospholipase C
MPAPDRSHALDHIVVVLFENRSLDNVLGHLYGPGDGKNFDGVIGKELTNPIPGWAEHGADRKVVPYTVATDIWIRRTRTRVRSTSTPTPSCTAS